ncbi:MAG: hypothetical protein EXR69_16565 [Myxococcales bacterium]|nr:hypothetical protein [Myxococcales bacterium]
MIIAFLSLGCGSASDVATLKERVAVLEAAGGEVDLSTLSAEQEAQASAIAEIESSAAAAEQTVGALTRRTAALEAAAGNDYWSVSGTCDCAVASSTWSDLGGATAYVEATKAGPVLAWGLVDVPSAYCSNHEIRLRMVASDGSWEDESVAMPTTSGCYTSNALSTTFGQFEIPASGDYLLTLQYTGPSSSSTCSFGNFAVSAFQLAVAP